MLPLCCHYDDDATAAPTCMCGEASTLIPSYSTYTHTHIHVHTCCSEGRGGAEHTAGRQLSCWLAGWLVSIASLACMLFGGCLFLIGSEPINHDGAQTLCHFRSSVIPVFRSPLMLGMPAYGIKCKGVTNDGRMEGNSESSLEI